MLIHFYEKLVTLIYCVVKVEDIYSEPFNFSRLKERRLCLLTMLFLLQRNAVHLWEWNPEP